MNQEQEKALRDWLQEAIVPLIEQVLVKKLGQAMSYAASELVQPKREWVGLTEEERIDITNEVSGNEVIAIQKTEAKLKEKNT